MRLPAEAEELTGDVLFTVSVRYNGGGGRSCRSSCGQCFNKWLRHIWVPGGDVTSLEVYCLGGLLCTGPRT